MRRREEVKREKQEAAIIIVTGGRTSYRYVSTQIFETFDFI